MTGLSARFYREARKTALRCAAIAKREGDEKSRQTHLAWARECRAHYLLIEKETRP